MDNAQKQPVEATECENGTDMPKQQEDALYATADVLMAIFGLTRVKVAENVEE